MTLYTTGVEMATPNTAGSDTYVPVGPDVELSDVEFVDTGIPTPISILLSDEDTEEEQEDFHSQYFPSTPSELGNEDVEEYNLRSGRTRRNLLEEFLEVEQEQDSS